MNLAIAPPSDGDAEPPMRSWRRRQPEVPPDLLLQYLKDARYSDNHRNAIVMSDPHDLCGIQLAGEGDRAFQKHRNKQSHRLSEHMAERQQVENADRLKWFGPLSVFCDFFLKRPQVGANVAVPMHDSMRRARCAGRVDDFDNVVRVHLRKIELLYRGATLQCVETRSVQCQSRAGIVSNACGELLTETKVHGYNNHA